jgi:aconitase A
MKHIFKSLVVAALAATAATPALADHHGGKDKGKGYERKSPEERFKKIDANGDGMISLEEFTAHHAKMKEKWKEKKEKKEKYKDKKHKDHKGDAAKE